MRFALPKVYLVQNKSKSPRVLDKCIGLLVNVLILKYCQLLYNQKMENVLYLYKDMM